MALAFKIIRFNGIEGSCQSQTVNEESFKFDFPIRRDWNDHPIVDVALKYFDIEYLNGGQPLEYVVNRELAKVELEDSGHDSGTVKATVQIRPVNPAAAPSFGYRATIHALVIADLMWPE
ncbi:hypothetical protein AB0O76_16595 [Streptomyces sp. NPDC086554]|uniref:hypothetical protein n=1 Tax=Streptomyces sp. NPDC086554 TaxID=3154864 RepID=UPI003433629F